MTLVPTTRLGPYEIVAPLGAGGMGEVYRAKDTRLGREVAIKVLPAEVASDPDRLRRFEQEAKAASALNHPNILTVFDLGEHESTPYLVLELLEGRSLREILHDGQLPAHRAIEIGAQIARGLAAAHGRGIVHRDLKPENIFLTRDGVAKILDFGLAKQVRSELSGADLADASTRLETSAGIVLGTVGYMAPEQVRGERADARSDLFAFGALLYELLTGQRAFRGATTVEILNAILKEEPPPLAETNPAPPAAAQRVVERCLAKDPARRFQSAADLAFALEGAALPASSISTAVPPLASMSRRRRLWLLAAVLAVAGAGAGLWVVARSEHAAEPPVRRFQLDLDADSGARTGSDTIFRPVLSPDGRSIAFARDGKLWLRELDQLAPRALPGTEGAVGPFWSPDSGSVAFVAETTLKRVDLRSGAVTSLGALPGDSWTGGSWSPSGTILVGLASRGLFEVPERGGSLKLALAPNREKGEWDFHSPHFLPDGRSYLFTLHPSADTRYSLLVRSAGSSRVLIDSSGQIAACGVYDPRGYLLFERMQNGKSLLAVPFSLPSLALTGEPFVIADGAGGPSVSRDGTLLFVSGGSAVAQELVVVDRAGQVEEVAGEPFDQIRYPAFSPDAARIAFSGMRDGNTDVWVFDRGRRSVVRITTDPVPDENSAWSPDGSTLAYASGVWSAAALFVRAADGSGEAMRLTPPEQNAASPVWTPDGRQILYRGRMLPDGKIGLWSVPADGSAPPGPLAGRDDEVAPRLSADGRFEAFASSVSGRPEIYVRPFPTGSGRWPVSANGGLHPRWSRAGDELFYQVENVLMSAPVDTRGAFRAGLPRPLFIGDAVGVRLYSFGQDTRAYDISPDGQHVVAVRALEGRNRESVVLVENWQRDFRK